MEVEPLGDWRRTHYSNQLKDLKEGTEVTIFGWVNIKRKLGQLRFLIVRDMHGVAQVTIIKEEQPEIFPLFGQIPKQSAIGVRGIVRLTDKAPGGAEIIPSKIKLLNKSIQPLPLDPTGKVSAELDTRLNFRVMDLRRPQINAIFKINHEVLKSLRDFFCGEDFTEINTPKIIATATEGGTELFPIVFFGREAFLAQSPQLYKEQLCSVYEKVFEIGPVFRAEPHRTTRHLCELMMIDLEMAFADARDVMSTLDRLIHHVYDSVVKNRQVELEILGRSDLKVPKIPFPRVTYTECIDMLQKQDFAITWGEDLGTEACRKLGETYKGLYFIVDWPSEDEEGNLTKPFYIHPKAEDPKLADAFDLMWNWLELSSGGTRVHEKDLLIERLKKQGLHPEAFDFHLKAFDYGMPPHAGAGLGLSRILMILTGVQNVRECVIYPRDIERLTP